MKLRKNTMVRVIKRNDRLEKKRASKDHRQRNSGSQMKKTVESWVNEFKSERRRAESRQALAASLTTVASQDERTHFTL